VVLFCPLNFNGKDYAKVARYNFKNRAVIGHSGKTKGLLVYQHNPLTQGYELVMITNRNLYQGQLTNI
jgi:hypothetical protein